MKSTLLVRAALTVLGMAVALLAARAFFPAYVFHWDEVQLTLGLERFDLRVHHPHPPGYYLFVVLGRALAPFVATPENALRWVAALGGACFAGLIAWQLPARIPPWTFAGYVTAAAAFVVCSPLVLFYSISALTYTSEAVCWLAILLAIGGRPAGRRLYLLAAGIGLAGGIRQTLIVWSLVAVVALWLAHRRWLNGRRAIGFLAALAAGVVVWAVPMLVEVGGIDEYMTAAGPTLRGNVWEKSILHEGLSAARARLLRILADTWLAAGPLLIAAAAGLAARFLPACRERLSRWDPLLYGAALPLAFYTLLIYDTAGYILAVALPLAAYGFLSVAELASDRTAGTRALAVAAIGILASSLVLLPGGFASATVDLGYRSYIRHDDELEARVSAIRRAFKPANTVLVTSFPYWHWSFRHVMYYLPDYTVIQLIPDRFFVDAGPEQPYLTARGHEISLSGPNGLDVRTLGEAPIEQVVYVIPHDVTVYVTESCLPFLEPFPTTPTETLGVLRLSGQLDVRVSRAQLHCASRGPRSR